MDSDGTTIFGVAMDGRNVEEKEMLCGGNLEVLLEPVETEHLDVYRKIRDTIEKRGRGVMVTKFAPNPFGKSCPHDELSITGNTIEGETLDWCRRALAEKGLVLGDGIVSDPIQGSVPLYLFGVGHVAQFVVTIAKIADFDVTVIDDRTEFANRERFPEAGKILAAGIHDAPRSTTKNNQKPRWP